MKKISITLITVLVTIAGTSLTFAQNIPNNGFENWTVTGPAESPNNWAGTPGVTKSSDAHSGIYSMQIKAGIFTNPMTMINDTLPGIANTGSQGTGPGTGIKGFAFTARPDSIVGWYKYAPSGNDSAVFSVSLSVWNTTTSTNAIISMTRFVAKSQSSYTRFSFPINYLNTMIPDTANIELASSNSQPNHPTLGSTLLVDDVSFVYNSAAGIFSNTKNENQFTIYPNPTKEMLFVKVKDASNIKYSISITDVLGKKIITSSMYEFQNGINISQLPKGVYIIQLTESESKQTTSKNFVVE